MGGDNDPGYGVRGRGLEILEMASLGRGTFGRECFFFGGEERGSAVAEWLADGIRAIGCDLRFAGREETRAGVDLEAGPWLPVLLAEVEDELERVGRWRGRWRNGVTFDCSLSAARALGLGGGVGGREEHATEEEQTTEEEPFSDNCR